MREYGESKYNHGYSVDQTFDGGYIVLGGAYRGSNGYPIIIKTDSDGTVEWIRDFDNFRWREINSVQQTADGGYILSGSYASGLLNTDVLLMKATSDGNIPTSRDFHPSFQRLFERIINFFPLLKQIIER